MFDPEKLEHFLDGLQVETHFPGTMPQRIVEPPRSVLDAKMDRYDIFRQADGEYENVGISEFPVLAPKRLFPFNNPMYMPIYARWSTYGMFASGPYAMGVDTAAPTVPTEPVETPHDRLKAKMNKLAQVESVSIPDPQSSAESPDFIYTITAWRGWEFTNGMLESLGTDARWEPRCAPKANCRTAVHVAPDTGCHCGYWSFKTFEGLQEALAGYANEVDVIGQVEIWGRVVECENGFRSEYAYPKELWLLDEGMESLSWRYGVPVRKLG